MSGASEQQPKSLTSIISKEKTDHGVAMLKRVVEEAGGEWCGIQDTMLNPGLALLLFHSPASGSTLAVRFNPADFDPSKIAEAVHKRLAESDRDFADRTVPVKVSSLQRISSTLASLSTEIKNMYEKKGKS